jgi:dTDP-3,4-didehydro-2,6-dideoxy-alpha-D-glucose 3-reductase
VVIRVGVAGCSAFGARSMLPVLRDHPGVRLCAVASRDPARAAEYAGRFGGEPVTGYATMIARDDIDAVYLAVPNALHHGLARSALLAGRHVLAEKPLTTTAADAADLATLAGDRGLVLRENFGFLHHGQHRRVRELLRDGRLGTLRHAAFEFCFPPLPTTDIRYRPELSGGALLDIGVYAVRAMQLFLGDDVRLSGAALRIDPETGVDVSGSFLACTADGVIGTGSFGFEHTFGSRYQLWGSAGRLTVERAFTPPPGYAPTLRIVSQDRVEELTLPAEHQLRQGVSAFAEAVGEALRQGADPGHRQWAATAVRTAELTERIARIADLI